MALFLANTYLIDETLLNRSYYKLASEVRSFFKLPLIKDGQV